MKRQPNISFSPRKLKFKSPRKKRGSICFFNEKLDIITKNMKGANMNINNPDEFYMDFFKNLIKGETIDNPGIEQNKDTNNIKSNEMTINNSEKNIEISPHSKKRLNSPNKYQIQKSKEKFANKFAL